MLITDTVTRVIRHADIREDSRVESLGTKDVTRD